MKAPLRPLLLLLLAAVSGWGLWWLLQEGAPASTEPATNSTTALSPPGDSDQAQRMGEMASPGMENGISRENLTPDADIQDPKAAPGAGVNVTVVTIRRDGGEPLAQAEVWLFPQAASSMEEIAAWRRDGDSQRAEHHANGQSLHTDGKGQLQLTVPTTPFLLAAQHGELYGESLYNRAHDGDVLWLQLLPDHELRVRVQDERGQAVAAFPLAVDLQGEEWTQRVGTAQTDQTGLARLPHFESWLPAQIGSRQPVIRAAAPFREAPELKLDWQQLPQQELLLVLPPYGGVRLELLTAKGQPAMGPRRTFLQREDTQGDFWTDYRGLEMRADLGAGEVLAQGGVADYPFVGLGLQLAAGAFLDDSDRPFERKLQGPTRAGELIHATLQANQSRPRLHFRAVDDRGQPFALTDIQLAIRIEGVAYGFQDMARLHTDAAGRATYVVTAGKGGAAPEHLVIDFSLPTKPEDWRAQFESTEPLASGVIELGDLVFTRRPLVAAGHVLTRDGRALGGARVRVLYRVAADDWRTLNRRIYPAAEDGAFAIHGEAPSPELRLQVSHPDYPETQMDILPGSSKLRVIMDEGRELRGEIRLDAELEPSDLSVVVAPDPLPQTLGEAYWDWPQQRLSPQGDFRFVLADGGARTLLLIDSETAALLGTMPGVIPWPTTAEGDPRLQPWDRRGQVHRFVMHFVDEDGLPAQEVGLILDEVPGLGDDGHPEASLWRGTGTLLVPGNQLRFTAIGKNRRALDGLMATPGEETFVLRGGIPLVIQLQPAGALPKDFRVEMNLRSLEHASRSPNLWEHGFNQQGKMELSVPQAGDYRAWLTIYVMDPDRQTISFDFPAKEEQEVWTVTDSNSPQIFTLTLDAAAIAEALAGVEEPR